MGNEVTYHSVFETKNIVNGTVNQTKGLHTPGIFLRVRLVFCEVLLVESGEIVDVVS